MPLRDHFHPPWSDENPWEGFHSAWVNTMVRHLNGSLLPPNFRAFPQVHLGPFVEADVATFERLAGPGTSSPADPGSANGGAAAPGSPPAAVQPLDVEVPGQDVFEVRVHDVRRGMRLVAVVALVSPGNKDRPEERQTFVAKCAAYLQEQVGLVLVDIVTTRRANLYDELLQLLSAPPAPVVGSDLYCVSYRNRRDGRRWRLDTWPFALALGARLPTVPLWLAGVTAVPLDLEKSYEETGQVLRIT
jgi:Protein of unknown function (DUF4058)